jgi:hypothetical protein
MATPSYPYTSTTQDTVRIVYLQIGGGTVYWLSPGCTVTITGSKGTQSGGGGETDGEIYIFGISSDRSLILRVDAQISLYDDNPDGTDGIDKWPSFDPAALMYDFLRAGSNTDSVLVWRGGAYHGMVKTVTFTQRPGEGNLIDVAITFEVGDVSGS